ncbi:MAG: hypothetical protein LC101_09290 [Flavobacteriales bacterium]|nr:hypothetical protein [Flavobacteriales bacterium]
MLREIELWAGEEQGNSRSFIQNLDCKFKSVEQKMDKLVNVYLEGKIENYLKKRNEMLKEKADLQLKRSDFGQKDA